MYRKVLSRHAAILAALALTVISGCSFGSKNETEPQESPAPQELTGEVRVDGFSVTAPVSEAVATRYQDKQPKVKVFVGTSGTGNGFLRFCNGETDVANAVRPITSDEAAKCQAVGIRYTELMVAYDALAVVVSKENTWADCLTVEELRKTWDQGSLVVNWNQIRPTFPVEPLKLYMPDRDSGAFAFFTSMVNGEQRSRSDPTINSDNKALAGGVVSSKGGMGYVDFTYYEENQDSLKLLKVDNGDGKCTEPSLTAVRDSSYKPLSRPLYIYVNNASVVDKPHVKGFVDLYVKSVAEIVAETQFIPLTEAQMSDLASQFVAIK